jgi:hypothetical protein
MFWDVRTALDLALTNPAFIYAKISPSFSSEQYAN